MMGKKYPRRLHCTLMLEVLKCLLFRLKSNVKSTVQRPFSWLAMRCALLCMEGWGGGGYSLARDMVHSGAAAAWLKGQAYEEVACMYIYQP
jgi:hypothetical protein